MNILSQYGDGYFFEETLINGLSSQNEYKKIYLNSLSKAGDEKRNSIYTILRHISLYSYIEDVISREIEGDFAECGCFNGSSLFATKYLIDKYKLKKSFHIFDSFEGGLSEFTEKDLNNNIYFKSKKKIETITNHFSSSYELLKEKTNNFERLYLNKGWIPDVFNSQEIRNYSFVHIDVDLYEPTLESHKYFFEKLSKGGVIVCDDYGYNNFPGAKLAVDEFIGSIPRSSYTHFFKPSFGTSIIIK